MTPADLVHDLTIHGYTARVRGDEVQVHTCLFCDNDRWNLECNVDRGVYHCWACGAGGRLDGFMTKLTGQYYSLPVRQRAKHKEATVDTTFKSRRASDVQSAAQYLWQVRRMDAMTADSYGLLVCTEPDHLLTARITIPLYDYWTRALVGYIGRSYTGQRPKYVSTLGSKLITGYRMRVPETPCVVVEGAFDGIAVHRAGFNAAVLGGTSDPQLMEFAARIPSDVPVVLLLDGDARDRATYLMWVFREVHPDRVVQVPLPAGTDPANYLPDVLRTLLNQHLKDGN